jgi:hypothetical protein
MAGIGMTSRALAAPTGAGALASDREVATDAR